MSQIALTSAQRIQALRRFDYNAREAEFLCLVGLHGGYFLRRQYDDFLHQTRGGIAAQLIGRALAKGHARAFTYRQQFNLYHLCARPFYEALGQEDNRNRRGRQPLTIKNKVMGFDFVLEHRQHQYLATELEKLDYFTRTLQIPRSVLPVKLYQGAKSQDQTARYFVDKFPIFLPGQHALDRSSVVTFCFVDEGLKTIAKFETFLAQHRALFASLNEFGLVYVAASSARFDSAQAAFERLLTRGSPGKTGALIDPDIRRMLAHFKDRRLFEAKQFAGFDRDRLLRLRQDRDEFTGDENEALYKKWQVAGDQGILQILTPNTAPPTPSKCAFSTYLLEHDYDLFGTLTGH
jgi:hypothetical protein